MADLFLAVGEDHNHYAIVRDDNNGVTSVTKKHIHGIQEVREQDPESGKITTGVIVLPDENDGHTHELKSVDLKKKKKKITKNDSALFKRAVELTRSAYSSQADYVKRGVESDKFYIGGDGQWDEKVISKLDDNGQARITLNYTKILIDTLHGVAKENSKMLKFLPQENGDESVADMFTHLAAYFSENSNYEYERGESALDQFITGRGVMGIRIDGPRYKNGELIIFDRKYDADIVMEWWPFKDVAFGPHRKKDASDAEYGVSRTWISLAKLKTYITREQESKLEDGAFFNYGWKDFVPYNREDIDDVDMADLFSDQADFIDVKSKKIALMTFYEKKYDLNKYIVDMNSGYEINLEDYELTKAQERQILSIDSFERVTKRSVKLKETMFAGGIHISTQEKDFDIIPFVPAYATKRGNVVTGKIDDLKDPQRERNHRRSSLSDQANKSGKGYFVKPNTFDDTQTTLQEFVDMAGTNGWVAVINEDEEEPKESAGLIIDQQLVTLDQVAARDMDNISGIDRATLTSSQIKSSVLFQDLKASSLLGNAYLFEGQSIQQRQLGRLMLQYFKIILTPERIYRILNKRHLDTNSPSITIGGQPFDNYSAETIARLFRQSDVFDYDVIVSESDYSPSKQLSDFKSWAQYLGQIKDPSSLLFLLELAPFPPQQKEKLRAIAQQSANQASEMAQLRSQTELQKTAMAQEGKRQ